MPSILVIDDDPAMRATMRSTLEKAGYDVIDAPDGREAIDQLRKRSAELVITDILMPGMEEGIEVICELRDEFPDVPVIAMSGGSRKGVGCYLGIAQTFGARRTLRKPFARTELLDAVRDLLAIRD